jgi:hypothetical protein
MLNIHQLNNNKHISGLNADLLKVKMIVKDFHMSLIKYSCEGEIPRTGAYLIRYFPSRHELYTKYFLFFCFCLKINSAFSQLYRAQIFECAWLDFEARKNPTIHEKK